MTLTLKEKELVAVAVSVAAGCKPCTNYHLREVRKATASDAEIRRTIASATSIRRRATDIMEAHALEHLRAAENPGAAPMETGASRAEELIAIGAAFAINCTSSLEKHLGFAALANITQDEVRAVAEIAAFVKRMAASHVEKLVGMHTDAQEPQKPRETGCHSCG